MNRLPYETLREALRAGLTPYQICCCPKLEGSGSALVVGWSPGCLLHEGENPAGGTEETS